MRRRLHYSNHFPRSATATMPGSLCRRAQRVLANISRHRFLCGGTRTLLPSVGSDQNGGEAGAVCDVVSGGRFGR